VHLAIDGAHALFAYPRITGNWQIGSVAGRLLVTDDAGRTWRDHALDRDYVDPWYVGAVASVDGGLLLSVVLNRPVRDRGQAVAVQAYRPADAPLRYEQNYDQAIRRWIDQLTADSWARREQAMKLLQRTPAFARPHLLDASASEDPEVRLRARQLLGMPPPWFVLDELPDAAP